MAEDSDRSGGVRSLFNPSLLVSKVSGSKMREFRNGVPSRFPRRGEWKNCNHALCVSESSVRSSLTFGRATLDGGDHFRSVGRLAEGMLLFTDLHLAA